MVECSSVETKHTDPFPSSLVSWLAGSAAAIFAGTKVFGGNLVDRVQYHLLTLNYILHVIPTSLHSSYHSASMPAHNVDAHQLRHVWQKGGA
jgi:hypothetical protein